MEKAIEALCSVVDKEVVPGIRSLCEQQSKHNNDLHNPKNGIVVRVTTLEERSRWTKALMLLGIGSVLTALFTLIVAVIIPAIGG